MSEHQAYERSIGAPASTAPRGRFRTDADGNDRAINLYRHWPRSRSVTPNDVNPRNGRPLPRVNSGKRALRAVAAGIAL